MSSMSIPKTFVNGNVITASPFNVNFNAIENFINGRENDGTPWDNFRCSSNAGVPLFIDGYSSGKNIFQASGNGTIYYFISDGGVITANQSSARAYKTVSQDILSGATTKITFNNESWDKQSEFDLGTSKFTCSKTGKYFISCGFWGSPLLVFYIYINGVEFSRACPYSDITNSLFFSDIIPLTAADYVEFFAENRTGSTVTINSGELYSFVSITKVG